MQVLSVQDGDAGDDGPIPNVDLSQLKSKDLDALAAVFHGWIQASIDQILRINKCMGLYIQYKM